MTNSNFVGCSTGRSAGLGALQDLVHVGGGARHEIHRVRVVGHQAAGFDHRPVRIQRRQPVLGREFDHSFTLSDEDALGRRQESFGLPSGASVEEVAPGTRHSRWSQGGIVGLKC